MLKSGISIARSGGLSARKNKIVNQFRIHKGAPAYRNAAQASKSAAKLTASRGAETENPASIRRADGDFMLSALSLLHLAR